MADKLIPINLPPGVFRNGTRYQAKSRWHDSHLVRWYDGAIRPVGGWGEVRDNSGVVVDLVGFPRGALGWRRNDGGQRLAFGTTGTPSKLYVLAGGALTDVTPAGLANSAPDGAFSEGSGPYGRGLYGRGLYGKGSTGQTLTDADTWSLDNFGEVLVGVLTADGRMWRQDGLTAATVIANAPTNVRSVVVTPERFLMALGASGDKRLVHWASQETETDWDTGSATNSAGDFPLTTHGAIVSGRRTSRETLIWTDTDIHAATFIGGSLVYAFEQRGDNCGLFGPNAVATVGTRAYWMSENKFFVYDGTVRAIPSEVSDFVFTSINRSQRAKVFALPVAEFGEVWWFYPSDDQTGLENDRYVAYNYESGFWMVGSLARAAGVPGGVHPHPVLVGTDGIVYQHETGDERAGADEPYLESGPFEIGDGDRFLEIDRIVPDEATLGDVSATFFVADYPTEPEVTHGPFSLANPTDVRFSARQARLRLEQNVERSWRVGVFRLRAKPGVGR